MLLFKTEILSQYTEIPLSLTSGWYNHVFWLLQFEKHLKFHQFTLCGS